MLFFAVLLLLPPDAVKGCPAPSTAAYIVTPALGTPLLPEYNAKLRHLQ